MCEEYENNGIAEANQWSEHYFQPVQEQIADWPGFDDQSRLDTWLDEHREEIAEAMRLPTQRKEDGLGKPEAGVGPKPEAGLGRREAGVGKREAGLGKREAGLGKREAGVGKREAGLGKREAGLGRREAGVGKREDGAGTRPPEAGLGQKIFQLWNIEPGACEVCVANRAAGPVPEGEDFPSGDTEPPAHEWCRCWLSIYYPPDAVRKDVETEGAGQFFYPQGASKDTGHTTHKDPSTARDSSS